MGDLILTDFKSRTWHKPKTLEQQAAELTKEFNRMAEEGTEVVCEMVSDTGDCA